jgi:hypothetical protein
VVVVAVNSHYLRRTRMLPISGRAERYGRNRLQLKHSQSLRPREDRIGSCLAREAQIISEKSPICINWMYN